MKEENLLRNIKIGKVGSFKELVLKYQDKVINTCYRFVNNYADAEDIAQEVFIEIHQSIKYFKEESKLSTWIYRIAINKSLDFLRKNNRKKRLNNIRKYLGIKSGSYFTGENEYKDPQKILEDKDRIMILEKSINKLPENQK